MIEFILLWIFKWGLSLGFTFPLIDEITLDFQRNQCEGEREKKTGWPRAAQIDSGH